MRKYFVTLFVALLSLNGNSIAGNIDSLYESLQPLTTSSEVAHWVTFESELTLPTNEEEYLLLHYVNMLGNSENGMPESYEKLKYDFNQVLPDNKGYPLLNDDGSLNDSTITFWLDKQIEMQNGFNSGNVWKNSRVLDITIDHTKSAVDEVTKTVKVVYKFRRELELRDKKKSIDEFNLDSTVPKNLHDLYYKMMETASLDTRELRRKAIELLSQESLPVPYLKWKKAVTSVKNSCLGTDAIDGTLTMSRFLGSFNHIENNCLLGTDILGSINVTNNEAPLKDVKVYPEYNELFKDGKLSVLFAIQKCNDRRYYCSESDIGRGEAIAKLIGSLSDYGYNRTDESDNISKFSRKVGDINVEVTLFQQERPVHYQSKFWELYPNAEIIFTNRLPLNYSHFWKLYSPKYQILVGPQVGNSVWGRILPQLDYELVNFDSVRVNLDRAQDGNLLSFLEDIVQTSKVYKLPLAEWEKDSEWGSLLRVLEKEESNDNNAAAYYVRNNRYIPESKGNTNLDFAAQEPVGSYIDLLNYQRTDKYEINKRDVYLYLTMLIGEQESSFESLSEKLQGVCGSIKNESVKSSYFFKDCTPRAILTNINTTINGINFATGSYLDLYHGASGIPKSARLADSTKIGEFSFKAYFEDNGGVVIFNRETGKVKQGHLAMDIDFKISPDSLVLPLLGGKGTSMVTFYENDSASLKTARLRKNAPYKVGEANLVLRGNWLAPNKVEFYDTGELECAYLAEIATIQGMQIDFVPPSEDAVVYGSSKKRVCFHANWKLKYGVLASEFKNVDGTNYPVGTRVVLDDEGKIVGPIYKTTKEGEQHWKTPFPSGSLVTINTATGDPQWIRLNGELRLWGHTFPKGTEISFSTSTEGLESVKAPKDGRAVIRLQERSISVPEGATMVFDEWEMTPSQLIFDEPVELGGITYSPKSISDRYGSSYLNFHSNGQVYEGILGASTNVKEPHYGNIPLRLETRVEFDELGDLMEGTLESDFEFVYKKTAKEGDSDVKQPRNIKIPAGSEFSIGYEGKLSNIILGSKWMDEKQGITVEAGGKLSLDEVHSISRLYIPKAGGVVKRYSVQEGWVDFYENKQPKRITLSNDAVILNMHIPAGSQIEFFESGKIKEITAGKDVEIIVDIDERKFTRNIEFYESGKVKRGYLYSNVDYSDVKIASLSECQRLRFTQPSERADSCLVSFYQDGISVMRGISAETFELKDGRIVIAGQPVMFYESGELFFE